MTTILSIQSTVAYGHVGNSAAAFPLMRVGVTVWPVATVHFSNHTGYGSWRGPLLAASDIADVVQGIDERGVLGQVDAVLSGYQGAEDVGTEVLRAFDLVRQRNPEAIYCCDPVIGDVGRGVYVRPGIPEFMRDRVVPAAQIVTPNHFELDYLTQRSTKTIGEVLDATDALRASGPSVVLVTSVLLDGDGPDQVLMVVDTAEGSWQVATPHLDRNFTGSGDLTAALFLANYLQGQSAGEAMANTAGAVYSLLEATAQADSAELMLVEAQDQLVAPAHRFETTRLR